MSTETAPLVQSIALGSIFVAIAAVTDSAYAISAARLGPVVGRAWRARAMARYLSGGVFIGLALFTVLAASERAR